MSKKRKASYKNILGALPFMLLLLAILPVAAAEKQGSIKLLTVSVDDDEEVVPAEAQIELQIMPGRGRVFIHTIPFAKLDTQMSARFAKEMACQYLDLDCSRYDFFYTINANTVVVGGPSGGAAISALTIAVLADLKINKSVSVTGTINSGGLVGGVGSLKDKIDGANKLKLEKVLVAQGSAIIHKENITIDIVEYGKSLGINVIEVSTLDDVVFELTGYKKPKTRKKIVISQSYSETMKQIREELCQRGIKIQEKLDILENTNNTIEKQALKYRNRSENSFSKEKYYSSASFCFGANIHFRYLEFLNKNLSKEEISVGVSEQRRTLDKLEESFKLKKLTTITDLQTKMIVQERLNDALEHIKNAEQEILENRTIAALWDYAYATERIFSAKSWSSFFNTPGRDYELDNESLKEGCMAKIGETKERINYVEIFLPLTLEDTRKQIKYALDYLSEGDYEMCLFKASKAKAEADVIISAIGTKPENFDSVLARKINVVNGLIAEQQQEDIFPILGYSYLEYSESLKQEDPESATLYVEYALELSNLDIYFRKKGNNLVSKSRISSVISSLTLRDAYFVVLGFILAALTYAIFLKTLVMRVKRKEKTKARKGKRAGK